MDNDFGGIVDRFNDYRDKLLEKVNINTISLIVGDLFRIIEFFFRFGVKLKLFLSCNLKNSNFDCLSIEDVVL